MMLTAAAAAAAVVHFCRATLTAEEAANGGSTSLCSHCASREGEIYARSLAAVNSLEQQFGKFTQPLLIFI